MLLYFTHRKTQIRKKCLAIYRKLQGIFVDFKIVDVSVLRTMVIFWVIFSGKLCLVKRKIRYRSSYINLYIYNFIYELYVYI